MDVEGTEKASIEIEVWDHNTDQLAPFDADNKLCTLVSGLEDFVLNLVKQHICINAVTTLLFGGTALS